MAIEQLTKNVEIIQTLSDYPNTDNGLTPAELKRKFDEGSRVIKEYLNGTVVPAINNPHPTGLRMNYKPITAVSSLNYSKGDQDTDITVQPGFSYEEGRYLRHEDYDGEPIILRGVAPGVKETDAVNLGQLQDKTKPLTVTIDVDHSIASYTAGDILAAYAADQDVRGILRESDGREIRLSLLSVDAYYAVFVKFADDNSWEKYLVTAIGAVEYYSEYYALADFVENAISRLGPLIVTVDEGAELANHTSDEIQAHSKAGGDVYLDIDGCLVPLSWVSVNDIAVFEKYVAVDKLKVSYLVWDDGTVEKISTKIATAEDLSAAIQNSEKEIINKLCPSFSESGTAVRCEPLEGSPLKVTTAFPSTDDGINNIKLTLCGKNLFDYTDYPFEDYLIYDAGGAANPSSTFSAFRNYMPVGHLKGLTITLNHPGAESNQYTHAALVFYDADKNYISGSNGYSHVVPDNAEYIRFSVPRVYADGTQVQLELGDRVTDYEPSWQHEYTAELDEPRFEGGSHVWSNIKAHAGVNTIWSSVGTTSVEGKSDPVAIIEKLTNAVVSLGGNI